MLPALLIVLTLLSAEVIGPPTPVPALQETADTVMEKVRKRLAESDQIRYGSLKCGKTGVEEDMNKAVGHRNRIKATKVFEIYGKNGQIIQRLIEQNGKPIKNAKEVVEPVDNDVAMLDRYEFQILDTPSDPATVLLDANGTLCQGEGFTPPCRAHYVVHFKPKKGLKFKIREDELLNRIEGKMYVDAETSFIRKAAGKAKYATGGLFSVTVNGTVEMNQQELGKAVQTTQVYFEYSYDGWVASGHNRETITYTSCSVVEPPPVPSPTPTQ